MRTEPNEVPSLDTVFLVGSGIDKNGWAPVLSAINEFRPEAHVGTDPDAANYFFATHVYQRRFLEQNRRHEKIDQTINNQLITQWSEFDLSLKKSISRHLGDATERRELHLRKEFVDIYRNGHWGKHIFITANWDMLLEKDICSPSAILHIHGSIANPSLLYLPSEWTEEPFRPDAERAEMALRITTMWKYIAKAPRLVIYGLSLSALDAELGHILSVGLGEHKSENPCEVLIYDCATQVERVERRARMFLTEESTVRFERHPLSC
ncbi:hypothetical protein [Corallococcus carmarthensis]|uniref:hypothetical protein n=1 Tax=Corallococcus carmarthensis TaxID=2316728 RepID=UPI0011C484C1|nr:hypothetical protein [Corallococcus carmarthensis]